MIGRTIAHYEITGKLGEGAMGEVYRATDTLLKREVAIKTLSSRVASDPGLVARLRREAEILASLSHAHIGQIYGLEEADDSLVLVLELVEGPTLGERMEQGALPREQALKIAHQIAAALETAHEGGVIHRDLKPVNIKLTPHGDVKVLDFGLAKGVRLDGKATELTADGAVLGTPAYMSPEQIEGHAVDRRTDVWSFGCVLFEMLTGTRVFAGDSVGSLFAAIATHAPDLNRIADCPPRLRRLVERCLRKDSKSRLRDIGDARVELEDLLAGRLDVESAGTPARTRLVAPILALVLGIAVGALVMLRPAPERKDAAPAMARYSITLPGPPAALTLDCPTGLAPPLAVSPDGRAIVFAAHGSAGIRRLYLRTADSARVRPLPGTDGAELPFFSPDGKQIGFFLHGAGHLHRFSLVDESVQRVGATSAVRGASWGADDTIVFADTDHGLVEIDLTSGQSRPLTKRTGDELDHRWPQVLPDGKSILFTVSMRNRRLEPRILSIDTGEVVALDLQGSFARYLPSGYLVYVQAENLWAVRFDLATRKIVGDQALVVRGIHISELGNPHFAVSASGVLVYEPIRPPSPGRGLVWVDRAGKTKSIHTGRGYEFPRISSDQRWLLFADHTDTANHDIWTLDLESGNKTKKVTHSGNYIQPVWSPDSLSIVFCSFAARNLYTKKLGESTARPLLEKIGWQYPIQWTRENRLIFTHDGPGSGGGDVVELNLDTMTTRDLVATPDTERAGSVSPDGRWLAYVSNETGAAQVYIGPYREPGRAEAVSRTGGSEPVWSSDSRELFFRKGRALFVAKLPEQVGQPIGEPQKLFEGPYVIGFFDRPNYDVSRDGTRFVMVEGGWGLTKGRLDLHLHFDREIEAALTK